MTRKCLYDVLLAPINTEKAVNCTAFSKYVFKVHPRASKDVVKLAVEKVFDVKVRHVNILNVKPYTRTFKGIRGVVGAFKKAVVSVEKGAAIDFLKM
ncbi:MULTISPECIES: 50S ribosomal protein L23 [unclassified Candidatus Lariskella]|uniref:50S ribosomal protein L23 n=1 Tax=unclassified Candidatus Lariskella TaxID=2632605 RepID=UPI0030D1ECA9